jgi:hypothetical protein
MKVFIATPAFDGRVHVQYAIALADTCSLLRSQGIDVQINMNSSGSLLVAERNRLNKQFLASDCTHMLCIDSDLGWPPVAVKAMLDHDVDFVAGLYPARGETTFLFRPVYSEDKAIVKHESKNLLKMNYVPAGFMLMKRIVLERMTAHFSHLYFEPKSPTHKNENGTCLFNTEIIDGEFWGEDYIFCKRARESSFELWVDPLIQFDHSGTKGCVSSILTNEKPKEENEKIISDKSSIS